MNFTITLTVDNSNYSADTIYSYIINLNNSNEAPAEPKELEFTFDGNTVIGYTGSETNITIPSSYSIRQAPVTSFVLAEQELSGRPSSETFNKMGMLYALKNYTIYPSGQTEGILCENGIFDAEEYIADSQYFPIKVELPEDLTFELTEDEMKNETPDQYTTYKMGALQLLQNFYVKFGNEPEEVCLNYDDYMAKFNERMPDGPNSTYFPIRFRINNIMNKYFEGDDYQVEVIGESAFADCSNLTSVSLPSTLTSIGERAFYGCSNLTSVTIEGGTSTGDFAFQGCSSLTSVFLSSTLTSIGDYAFYGCSSLTSITIPEGVTSIGYDAFDRCSGLTSIQIPEGVTSIGIYAFNICSSLTSVSLPSTLTSIGRDAFNGCYALTIVYNNSSLNITAGYSGNGDVALYAEEIVSSGEEAVGKIEIVDGVQYYVNKQTGKEIALAPSVPRDSLISVTIREGTTEINQEAFDDCSNLTSVSLPSTLTSIGRDAFQFCYALAIVYNNSSLEITAGSTVNEYVGYYAKEIVSSGEEAVGKIEIVDYVQYYVNEQTRETIALAPSVPRDSLTSITIREGTTEINQEAFDDCSNLTSITIPEGVTSIGDQAFYNCSSLTSVSLPSTLTSIGRDAFSFCSNLTEITINGNITSLGIGAFSDCSKLTSLTLGKDVSTLPSNLFDINSFSNLTKIVVLGDLTSETFPSGIWVKDGVVVTSFDGPGTYTTRQP